MNRRHFIRTSSVSLASFLIADSLLSFKNSNKASLINFPDLVTARVNDLTVSLTSRDTQVWGYKNLLVELKNLSESMPVLISAPNMSLSSVTLKWKLNKKISEKILNDQWERTYGESSWHKPDKSEILPWYFLEHDGKTTNGFGVKTGASSFCHWQIEEDILCLILNTQSGGSGVELGNRKLIVAEIVAIKGKEGQSPFQTGRDFAKLMCDKPRMPSEPVYGINDWYFTYGSNSEKLILEHTELMMPMAAGLTNKPFSVIDAGWFNGPPSSPNDCCWGDRMDIPNAKFGDMHRVAEKIRSVGMRPAVWTRPLCGSYKDPKSIMLPIIPGREENKPVLDPSIAENLERIKGYLMLYNEWSYEMVKFDFTSYDIFGKWGFEMLQTGLMTPGNWKMNNQSLTNAEIVLGMYKVIREAAGNTYIIGCNTFSHLSAGLFELNRIGDDTSGNEWDRTRKMGVNTLAFRGIQHGTFYAADADCVGLTTKVPWDKNKQWMELVAKSGTPLFISAQPEATGLAQKEKIKECFRLASQTLPVGEPLDWLENKQPIKWKLNGQVESFNWDS